MAKYLYCVIDLFVSLLILLSSQANGQILPADFDPELFEANLNVSDISKQLREVIEHFKKADPVGLPGAPIPDPLPTPDMKYTKSLATLTMKNSKIHGLSQFRIEQIQTNLHSLEVDILLSYQKLEVLGNYTVTSFFSKKSAGPYNITILQVTMGGMAHMDTTREGHLKASKLDLDLSIKDIKMDFKNSGFLLSVFQGMMNHIGGFVFDTIKPYVLTEVNTNIQNDVNKMLSRMKRAFPNSIPPLDLFVAEGRKFVRESGYDPFPVEDYKYNTGLFGVTVRDILLTGLGSFYRTGNMTVAIKKNTVYVDSHISTQQLEGKCSWQASLGQFLSSYGSTEFTIQYVQVRTRFNQSLDLRNRPFLEDIDIRLGNIQLRMDGLGTMDYALELVANVLPNLLRYEIVDAVEGVLKQRIQTHLGTIQVEELVEQKLIKNLETVMATNDTITDIEGSYEITDNPYGIDELYDEIFL